MRIPVPADFDKAVANIDPKARNAEQRCQALLKSDTIKHCYQVGGEYAAIARGYECRLKAAMGYALANRGDYSAAQRSLKEILPLVPKASFTEGTFGKELAEKYEIDIAILAYMQGDIRLARQLLGTPRSFKTIYRAHAKAMFGRLLIETGKVEEGIKVLIQAMKLDFPQASTKSEARDVLQYARRGQEIPAMLRIGLANLF